MASTSTSDAARRSSKRVSALPSIPKAPTSIDSSAVVANHAVLTGIYPIAIGPRAVLHPYAKIISGDGPIEIGGGCNIWEKAVVGSGNAAEEDAKRTEQVMKIVLGPNVVVESGAVVEAESVGEGTIIEAFAKVGDGASVGKVKTLSIKASHYLIHRNSSVKSCPMRPSNQTPKSLILPLSSQQINNVKTQLCHRILLYTISKV